jgi:hypothetical protein
MLGEKEGNQNWWGRDKVKVCVMRANWKMDLSIEK